MDVSELTLALLIMDSLITLLVARFYVVPRMRRMQSSYEQQGKSAFAAIAGLPEPQPGASWTDLAGAARVQIAAQTREALKSEFPALIEDFAPVLEARLHEKMPGIIEEFGPLLEAKLLPAIENRFIEAIPALETRFTEKILPAIEEKLKETLPALVTELAPVIGDALVRSGQEFFREKRPSNIETTAGQAGLAKVPASIDVGELLKNPQVEALAQQYGIDTSTLKGLPKKIAVPQGSDPLSLLANYIPQLKPVVSAISAIRGISGMMGAPGGGGVRAVHTGTTTEGDREFAERVLRR